MGQTLSAAPPQGLIAGSVPSGAFPLLAPDGSASAPSYSFSGNTNSGMYNQSGVLGFTTGGVFTCDVNSIGFAVGATKVLCWHENDTISGTADLIIARDAAATLALKNGTTAQTFRVYGTTTGPKFVAFSDDGTNGYLFTNDAHPLYLGVNSAAVCGLNASGHFVWLADNTLDLGAAGATRPRTGYFGTSLVVGTSEATTTTGNIYSFGSGSSAVVVRETGSNVEGKLYCGSSVIVGSATTHDLILQSDNANRVNISATAGIAMGPLPAANGQTMNVKVATTSIATTSGATQTATNLIPAGCFYLGVTIRVTTAVTGATSIDIGDGSDADRWGDNIAVALNTTTTMASATATGSGERQATALSVVLTANGSNFTGGAVRVTVYYLDLTAATS